MKITKRILVAMLALALLVAGFAFIASAEEKSPFSTDGINEIEDILEFYEKEVYVNNDLLAYDAEVTPKEGTVDQVDAKVQIPGDASAGYAVQLSKDEESMVFEFGVYMDADTVGNVSFDLKALLSEDGVADPHFTTLFQIDMISETPAIKYSLWDEAEEVFAADTVALKGITPKTETWYTVVLIFNAEEGTYRFSVTPENGKTVESPELSLGDKTAMRYFRLVGEFRNYTAEAKGKSASFSTKDVEIYGGSFVRDVDKRAEITATTLTDLAGLYKEAKEKGGAEGINTCIRIAEVYKALNASASFDGTVEDSDTVFNYAYAEALVIATGAIDSKASYLDRREAVAVIDRYNSFVPANDVLYDQDGKYVTTAGIDANLAKKVKSARELLEAERALLDAIQLNSIKFVDIFLGNAVETPAEGEPVAIPAYDVAWVDYDAVLVPYYTRIKALFAKADEQPDLTYKDDNVDMADVVELWADLEGKMSFVEDSTADFKKLVDILKNTEKKFGVRYYNGYLPAKAYHEEISAEDNFAILATSKTFTALVTTYNTNAAKMKVEEKNCNEFIKLVAEASLATYYTALVERLEAAKAYIEKVQDDYEGIVEAKATYTALRDAIVADKGNADVYIEKVAAAEEVFASKTSTFAEKKAALKAATDLKSLGNVYGYEGVSEANISLSKMESDLAFVEGNSITLVALVDELAKATTLTERRALIRLAKDAAENSEATYEGVAAAKTALDAAVTAFNKIVDTANAALADATVNAASVAAAISGDAGVYKTASIIQDYAK